MFDNDGLMNYHKTVFMMSGRLSPSEIEMMVYVDFKIYLILYNAWIEEKNK